MSSFYWFVYNLIKLVFSSQENGAEVSVHEAWSELSYIEREQERYVALRSATLKELDACRQTAVVLENVSFFYK